MSTYCRSDTMPRAVYIEILRTHTIPSESLQNPTVRLYYLNKIHSFKSIVWILFVALDTLDHSFLIILTPILEIPSQLLFLPGLLPGHAVTSSSGQTRPKIVLICHFINCFHWLIRHMVITISQNNQNFQLKNGRNCFDSPCSSAPQNWTVEG